MVIEILMLVGYVFVATAVLLWSLPDTARRNEVDKALQQIEEVCKEKQEKLGGQMHATDDRLDDIRRRA